MLRNEKNESHELKIPQINRAYFDKYILTYQNNTSRTIQLLKQLNDKIPKENEFLSDKQVFNLMAIIHDHQYQDPGSQFIFSILLFNYFEPQVVAELDSDMFRQK